MLAGQLEEALSPFVQRKKRAAAAQIDQFSTDASERLAKARKVIEKIVDSPRVKSDLGKHHRWFKRDADRHISRSFSALEKELADGYARARKLGLSGLEKPEPAESPRRPPSPEVTRYLAMIRGT